jgi:hypothetical protein
MNRSFATIAAGGAIAAALAAVMAAHQQPPKSWPTAEASAVEHVVVFKEPGRYGGWPANHGIWAWGDEILVGFSAGHMDLNAPKEARSGAPARHPIDRTKPEQHLLARSLDGGRTWKIEHNPGLIPPSRTGHMAGVPTEPGGAAARPYPGDEDFTDKNFLMTLRMGDIHKGPSWFFTSTDRGHSWKGPFELPDLGLKGIAARTDYLVKDKDTMLVFLTGAKSNGREGRPFVARTDDAGRSFEFVSWIGPEPDQGFVIMPSSVRLDDGTIVVATRRQVPDGRGIDIYSSSDEGRTWKMVTTAVENTGRGNPPSMVRLTDGRLALTYGVRAEPYGIRAKLSADGGRTWGREIVLRADAADWDLGYTRTVQRADGKLVTVYYYNDPTVPERYIAGTIWDPREPGT